MMMSEYVPLVERIDVYTRTLTNVLIGGLFPLKNYISNY